METTIEDEWKKKSREDEWKGDEEINVDDMV